MWSWDWFEFKQVVGVGNSVCVHFQSLSGRISWTNWIRLKIFAVLDETLACRRIVIGKITESEAVTVKCNAIFSKSREVYTIGEVYI
jgi:hypothetical protein